MISMWLTTYKKENYNYDIDMHNILNIFWVIAMYRFLFNTIKWLKLGPTTWHIECKQLLFKITVSKWQLTAMIDISKNTTTNKVNLKYNLEVTHVFWTTRSFYLNKWIKSIVFKDTWMFNSLFLCDNFLGKWQVYLDHYN